MNLEDSTASIMSQHRSITAIIPTKNRPDDLQRAVRSVLDQTVGLNSLIIVDQSPDDESRRRVEAELASATARLARSVAMHYIRDAAISGGAVARNRAMEIAAGDIWLFLDDDVILEPDFIEQLLIVYEEHPEVAGVSGIIANYQRPLLAARLWAEVFVRGPFRDERQPIYWNADKLRQSPPIPVQRFTGALMSFRSSFIRHRRFDENLYGVSDGEDVDFCERLGPDAQLRIAPRARLEHRHSAVRLQDHWLRRDVRGKVFLYRKNWKKGLFNRFCYAWLLTGYFMVAAVASIRRASLNPYRALRRGQEEARRAVPLSGCA